MQESIVRSTLKLEAYIIDSVDFIYTGKSDRWHKRPKNLSTGTVSHFLGYTESDMVFS